MNGYNEIDKCDYCEKITNVRRKYFRYNIKCDCHSAKHVEIRRYCKYCTPTIPHETKVTYSIQTLSPMEENKFNMYIERIKKRIRNKIRNIFCKHSNCRYKKYIKIDGKMQEVQVSQCFYCGRNKTASKIIRGDKGNIIKLEEIKNGKKYIR